MPCSATQISQENRVLQNHAECSPLCLLSDRCHVMPPRFPNKAECYKILQSVVLCVYYLIGAMLCHPDFTRTKSGYESSVPLPYIALVKQKPLCPFHSLFHMFAQGETNCSILPQYCQRTVSVLYQYCPSTVPILSQYCLSTVSVLSQYCPNTVSVLSQYCPSTVPILFSTV